MSNKLIFNDEEYHLLKIDSPEFMIRTKPYPDIKGVTHAYSHMKYKSIAINDEWFAYKPVDKSLDILSKQKLSDLGWSNYETHGSGFKMTKGFNGHSWWTLYYEEKATLLTISKEKQYAPTTLGQSTSFYFYGICDSVSDFKIVCKLLNIK